MLYLILLLFLLACIGLTALTVLDISTQVHITILNWQSPGAPVGFWMLGAFFLGALLLYLVSVASALHDRGEIRRLRQQVSTLQPKTGGDSLASGVQTSAVPAQQSPVMPPAQAPVQPYAAMIPPQGPQNSVGAVPAQSWNADNKNRYIPMPGIQPIKENLPPQHSGQ